MIDRACGVGRSVEEGMLWSSPTAIGLVYLDSSFGISMDLMLNRTRSST